MSLILNAQVVARGDAARAQYEQREQMRRIGFHWNQSLARNAGLAVNALPDLSPRAWLDLDTQLVQLIGQETDVMFTDIYALSRSVSIGKLVAAYQRIGTMDPGSTTLSGQGTKLMGQVATDYDGIVIPIHEKTFGVQWRELEGKRSIGADDIAENQAAATREVMRLMAVNMVDGNPLINYQGANAYGIKTNPNTKAVVLTQDMTSAAATYAQLQAQFNTFVQALRGPTNRATAPITVYISAEIEANLSRTSGATTMDRSFYNALLADTPGVTAIKTSSLLTGNQMVAVVLSKAYIEPVTGMAINTVPVPRQVPFADYHWMTWSASGLLIKSDQAGRSGVAYGASA
jgi:hypothetical protein